MQSKTDSNYRIPDFIVIEDDSKIPSRELTNQKRASRRRKPTRRPNPLKIKSSKGGPTGRVESSISRSDSHLETTESSKSCSLVTKDADGTTYHDSVVFLSSDDDVELPRRPNRPKRKPLMRRSSIDLGMLPSHVEETIPSKEPVVRRRKSIDHTGPTALPWSFDHNTDSPDDSSFSEDIAYFADPGEIVIVGGTHISGREIMDAMFSVTSVTLEASMMNLTHTGSIAEASMEPMLSLADLCGTLIPPRIVDDDARNEHGARRMSR